MREPNNDEAPVTAENGRGFDKGQPGMSKPSPAARVNSLVDEMSLLLRSSRSAQDAFWVAVLSGAAHPEGWRSTAGSRAQAFEQLRGKGMGPATFHEALDVLAAVGLLDVERDGGEVLCRLPESSAARAIFCDQAICTTADQHVSDPIEEKENPRDCARDPFAEGVLSNDAKQAQRETPAAKARALAEKLVSFWASRSGRRRVKLLERRVRMVRARLREGYEPEDLYQAIAGVCYSPFHQENGHDTFEVALRNGEQVEKGRRLWMLHAPIEFIEQHEQRTGERVASRSGELQARERERQRDVEFDKRLEQARAAQAAAEQARHEEESKDAEATALALAGLGDGGEGG